MTTRFFEEKQRFTQWWVWVILIAVTILVTVQLVKENTNELSTYITSFIGLALTYAFLLMISLQTRVDEEGIHVKMFPFHLSFVTYKWRDLYSAEVVEYSPLGDYGGWGLRISFRGKGKAFSVKGNKGIKIQTADGKTRMIGTQKAAEARLVLEHYASKIK